MYERDIMENKGKLLNVTGNVMSIMNVTGFDSTYTIQSSRDGKIFVLLPETGEVAIMDENYPGLWTKLHQNICSSLNIRQSEYWFENDDDKIFYTCPGLFNSSISIDLYYMSLFEQNNKNPSAEKKYLSHSVSERVLFARNYSQPTLFSSMNHSFDTGPISKICPW